MALGGGNKGGGGLPAVPTPGTGTGTPGPPQLSGSVRGGPGRRAQQTPLELKCWVTARTVPGMGTRMGFFWGGGAGRGGPVCTGTGREISFPSWMCPVAVWVPFVGAEHVRPWPWDIPGAWHSKDPPPPPKKTLPVRWQQQAPPAHPPSPSLPCSTVGKLRHGGGDVAAQHPAESGGGARPRSAPLPRGGGAALHWQRVCPLAARTPGSRARPSAEK